MTIVVVLGDRDRALRVRRRRRPRRSRARCSTRGSAGCASCSSARGSGSRSCGARSRPRSPPSFQFLGWVFQLLAVYAAMRGFRIYEPLVAAGLVLLMMNVVTVLPFWPGNVGLVQAAVAVSLAQYGVRYAQRLRLRDRAAADRGVGRDRDRDDLPRARGALVRDAPRRSRRRARRRSRRSCSPMRRRAGAAAG